MSQNARLDPHPLLGARVSLPSGGWAAAGYLLLAGLFYAPQLLGLASFPPGDFSYHFLPFSIFQRSELLAGRLPVWNPYTYAGHPFLADTQAAVFYPLSNLWLGLTLAWGSPGARLYLLQAEAVLHVALAGTFTYLLVRELTGRQLPALVAGCTFALSGYLTGYPPLQLAVLRTAIWLPLVLWLLYRAFARPAEWRWWAGAALAYATAFLAGHPQTFLHLSYCAGAWALFLLLRSWRPSSTRRRIGLALGLAAFYGLTGGLIAAQLMPSLEFTGLSVRASLDYAALSGGFPVRDTWQLLVPGVLSYFSPLYIGIPALGLVLMAVLSSGRHEHRALVLFFGGLALLALLISYGNHGFLYPLFYRYVPGWRLFRGQERAAYLVAFGLSVLAGLGAARVEGLSRQDSRRSAVVIGLALIAAVAAFGVVRPAPQQMAADPALFAWLLGKAAALATGLAILLASGRPAGWRAAALLALVAGDLALANVKTNLSPAGAGLESAQPAEAAAIQQAVLEGGPGNPGLPGRTYNEYRAYDDYGMLAGLEEVWGSSPLRLARYDALFQDFPKGRMARLLGVQYVLTWMKDLFEGSDRLAEFSNEKDTTYLHRVKDLHPRAWVVDSVRVADDAEARALLADPSFDLEAIATLPSSPPSNEVPQSTDTQAAGEVRLERKAPNALHIRVSSDRGGLLVVSENWMPGWQIVDMQGAGIGRDAPVLRADLTLLGVPIKPGVAEFDLVYWPNSVRYGLLISGATLVLLLVTGMRRLHISGRWEGQKLRRPS